MAHTTALETADVAKWVIRTGELFDATARNDQHEYVGRSLRVTGRGGSRGPSTGRPRRQPPRASRIRKQVEVKGWDGQGLFSNLQVNQT